MTGLFNWSTTASSNASVGSINFAEDQLPSTVNDSARALMADVAKWRDFLSGAKTTSGTDTITLTSGMSVTAYAAGQMFVAKLGGTNTGAATINIDSVGAVAVEINGAAVTAGDLASGKYYLFVYDGTAFQATRLSGAGASLGANVFTGTQDLDGNELILDADGDTSLTADTDDQIDVKIAGSDVANWTATALNLLDNILQRPVIKDYGETVNDIGATGGGTQDIDFELGNVVKLMVTTSTNTLTFSNPPASGIAGSVTLEIFCGGTQTVNFPSTVRWSGGTAPTLTDNTFTFTTDYATDDKLDATSHPLSNGDRVQVTTTGTLPTGLTANTQYFVINADTNDFELSSTEGGSAVDINTSDGSGTHTVHWGEDILVLEVTNGGLSYKGFAAGLDMQ